MEEVKKLSTARIKKIVPITSATDFEEDVCLLIEPLHEKHSNLTRAVGAELMKSQKLCNENDNHSAPRTIRLLIKNEARTLISTKMERVTSKLAYRIAATFGYPRSP